MRSKRLAETSTVEIPLPTNLAEYKITEIKSNKPCATEMIGEGSFVLQH